MRYGYLFPRPRFGRRAPHRRRLVGRSNQLLAQLLAHLAEVEARGIHRERACASLYTYCLYELRLSEDAASRRARAARITRQFPVLFDRIAAGEIHLTGILLLGPHLTEANHLEVLALAKHRTKKEIERLVRRLNPLPAVRAVVEPLGPAPRSSAANPSFSQLVEAYAPDVRELKHGDRPGDWIEEDSGPEQVAGDLPVPVVEADPPPLLTEPQQYKVQFTASQEYVDLLETAKDLLGRTGASRSIEEVHLRAMKALVVNLQKQKAGARKKPASASEPRQPGSTTPAIPRQRGRSVPRAVRRQVWERDGARCTYLSTDGQRCRETRCLELDHVHAHARGGPATVENLRLRSRTQRAHRRTGFRTRVHRTEATRSKRRFRPRSNLTNYVTPHVDDASADRMNT